MRRILAALFIFSGLAVSASGQLPCGVGSGVIPGHAGLIGASCGGHCGGHSGLLTGSHSGECYTCDTIWDGYCESKRECRGLDHGLFGQHGGACSFCGGAGCGGVAGCGTGCSACGSGLCAHRHAPGTACSTCSTCSSGAAGCDASVSPSIGGSNVPAEPAQPTAPAAKNGLPGVTSNRATARAKPKAALADQAALVTAPVTESFLAPLPPSAANGRAQSSRRSESCDSLQARLGKLFSVEKSK